MEHTRKMVLMPADYFDQVGNGQNFTPMNSRLQEPQHDADQNLISDAQPSIEPLQPIKENKKRNTLSKSRMIGTMQILLKLARIDAFDENGNLRTSAGGVVEGANIIDFITEALRESAALPLEDEFVNALHRAGVPPTLIVNERIRSQLLAIQTQNIESRHSTSEIVPQSGKVKKGIRRNANTPMDTFVRAPYSPMQSDSESYGTSEPSPNVTNYHPRPVARKRKRQNIYDEEGNVQARRTNAKYLETRRKPYKRPHSEDESDDDPEPYKKRFIDNGGDFFDDWDTNGNN